MLTVAPLTQVCWSGAQTRPLMVPGVQVCGCSGVPESIAHEPGSRSQASGARVSRSPQLQPAANKSVAARAAERMGARGHSTNQAARLTATEADAAADGESPASPAARLSIVSSVRVALLTLVF